MGNTIKIAIYEDESCLRDSLVELFEYEPLFDLRGAFGNCNRVISDMESIKPDIVLMDKEMPGVDGLQGLIQIKSAFPDIDVVMFTGMEDDETIFSCLQAGASGYINKGTPKIKLLDYLRIVHEGGTMFSPSIAARVRDFFKVGMPGNRNEFGLTPKEQEALTYLSDGLSQKLIATKMQISINGVAAHLRNIFRKLQVNSAPEAVAKAIRMRLLDRDRLHFR